MRYIYRCDCGWEAHRDYPMSEPVPEVLEDYGEHPAGMDGSRVLCEGELHRVYESSLINFGFRPHLHDTTEEFRFKNL